MIDWVLLGFLLIIIFASGIILVTGTKDENLNNDRTLDKGILAAVVLTLFTAVYLGNATVSYHRLQTFERENSKKIQEFDSMKEEFSLQISALKDEVESLKLKSAFADATLSQFGNPGATAICADGTYSFSQNRRGTCSYHGGVRSWLR